MLLAVNRLYNKSDYIPTIAWGRNSRFCKSLEVGDNIRIWGRLQSREYQKKVSDTEVVKKIAYEVSISKMERVTDENRDNVTIIGKVDNDPSTDESNNIQETNLNDNEEKEVI